MSQELRDEACILVNELLASFADELKASKDVELADEAHRKACNRRMIAFREWDAWAMKERGKKPTSTTAKPAKPPGDYPTLSFGFRGVWVEYLQTLLGGVQVDGIFGVHTESRVRAFQQSAGIIPDGVVVSFTWDALELERKAG